MKIPRLVTEAYDQVHRIWHNLGYLYRFLVFITPWLTVALYFALVLDYLPPAEANKYGVSALAYLFPPFGKESIIPYMLSSGDTLSLPSWLSWLGSSVGPALPPWTAWSMIIVMDVISSAILAYSWWFAEFIIVRIGILNRAYRALQRKADRYRKKRLLTLSLLLFMMIPFQGTGGISTTIIARLLGVSARKTILIVFVGSLVTTTVWILWWLGFFEFL
ncbi:MAG: small multi-drug export protein [Candidatus Thermoplasmatota archaeon]|nr:small multi-drug export protein [Candidatus Thermoplasmatota archaeon]